MPQLNYDKTRQPLPTSGTLSRPLSPLATMAVAWSGVDAVIAGRGVKVSDAGAGYVTADATEKFAIATKHGNILSDSKIVKAGGDITVATLGSVIVEVVGVGAPVVGELMNCMGSDAPAGEAGKFIPSSDPDPVGIFAADVVRVTKYSPLTPDRAEVEIV